MKMMIKKFTLLLMMLCPLIAAAQIEVGMWEVITPFSSVTDIIETPSKVFYLSGASDNGSLFSYNKETDETYAYSNTNYLSDNGIVMMKYNQKKGYLAVAYSTGTIDLIFDNGKVVAMSDIKDAPLTTERTIKHIGFDPDKDVLYVGTNFGLVKFNDKKFEVIETGMYNTPVDMVELIGDYLVLRNNNTLKYLPADQSITRLSEFKQLQLSNVNDMRLLDNGKVVALIGNNSVGGQVCLLDIDFENGNIVDNSSTWANVLSNIHDSDGFYTIFNNLQTIKIDGKGNLVSMTYSKIDGEGVTGTVVGHTLDGKELWTGCSKGVSSYKLNWASAYILDSMTPTRLNITPSNLNIGLPLQMASGFDGNVYVGEVFSDRHNKTVTKIPRINVIKNTDIYDVTTPEMLSFSKAGDTKGIGLMGVSPDEPDTYYIGNNYWSIAKAFVLKVKDGESVIAYNSSNMPTTGPKWGAWDIKFDRFKNLWASTYDTGDKKGIYMAPADKVRNNTVTADDWKFLSVPGLDLDSRILLCQKSDAAFAIDSRWASSNAPLYAISTGGGIDPANMKVTHIPNIYDQDGKRFECNRMVTMQEDKTGKVWIGTDNGIIEITNPAQFVQNAGTATVNRIKVPRNDGTNQADYLLSSVRVNDIAVDDMNRKWIATSTSGVYLVSEDGREIIENFTTSNSSIPSDVVFSVECDPTSNYIYFGTDAGLVRYSSTGSPAADSYDNVYAYPNPVRPDYTGWITVTGLMDNSLVKIADAAGNVFYQGVSEGGMFTWDGCNANGDRVKTGVYFVYASQNDNGSSGVVTKIMVIN